MAYRVQLPRLESTSTPDIAPTPEAQARRAAVMNAFTDLFRRLAPLFPDGLQGLDLAHPDIWAQIRSSETVVDMAALDYISGKRTQAAFIRAVNAHEAAWRRGGEAVASGRTGARP